MTVRYADGTTRKIKVRSPRNSRLFGDRVTLCIMLPFWLPIWLALAIGREFRQAGRAIWQDLLAEMRLIRCDWRSGIR
jgi:hypothetical protein